MCKLTLSKHGVNFWKYEDPNILSKKQHEGLKLKTKHYKKLSECCINLKI